MKEKKEKNKNKTIRKKWKVSNKNAKYQGKKKEMRKIENKQQF